MESFDSLPPSDSQLAHATELRAIWERAYFAAWNGAMVCGAGESWPNEESMVKFAADCANATVSAWPAMTAERDALIRKAVGG